MGENIIPLVPHAGVVIDLSSGIKLIDTSVGAVKKKEILSSICEIFMDYLIRKHALFLGKKSLLYQEKSLLERKMHLSQKVLPVRWLSGNKRQQSSSIDVTTIFLIIATLLDCFCREVLVRRP
jgi:hypothetical protein